jgi:hypothetical protein
MKKLIALLFLAALGFYVAWPAWSGYRIYTALNSGDAALLESKVDFPSVRESMRPAVTAEVERQVEQQMKQAGGGVGALLGGDLKKQLVPKLVDGVLSTLVTPANIITLARQGGSMAEAAQKMVMEQMGKVGGLPSLGGGSGSGGGIPNLGGLGSLGGVLGLPGRSGSDAAPPARAPAPTAPTKSASQGGARFGLGNIKSFSLDGPAGYAVSVAKDAGAAKPDLTAGLAFRGLDWKLTRLVPHL